MINRLREWWDERQYGQPYRDMVTRRQAEITAGTAGSFAELLMRSETGRRALYRSEVEHARQAKKHGRHRARKDRRDGRK